MFNWGWLYKFWIIVEETAQRELLLIVIEDENKQHVCMHFKNVRHSGTIHKLQIIIHLMINHYQLVLLSFLQDKSPRVMHLLATIILNADGPSLEDNSEMNKMLGINTKELVGS